MAPLPVLAAAAAVSPIVLSVARRLPLRIGLALVYHRIAPRPGDRTRELVPAMGLELFEQQLRFVVRKLRPVKASELWDAIHARKRGEAFPVAITFDDDWASHLEHAAPALAREGATATFFLCGASLGKPRFFWWELLQHAVDSGVDAAALLGGAAPNATIHALGGLFEYSEPHRRDQLEHQLSSAAGTPPRAGMSRNEIRGLHAKGFEIGFHTLRHDRLPDLSDAELHRAVSDGRDELEEVVGHMKVVSYPHGAADARVADAASAADFELGYWTDISAITPATPRHLLGRLEPSTRSARALELQVALALLAAIPRRVTAVARTRARPARRTDPYRAA